MGAGEFASVAFPTWMKKPGSTLMIGRVGPSQQEAKGTTCHDDPCLASQYLPGITEERQLA